MNFADNWARVFVVITFLGFEEPQIIGGMLPSVIAFFVYWINWLFIFYCKMAK